MTVKDLIKKLNEMPQDAEVEIVVPDSYGNHSSFPETVTLNKEGDVEIV